VDERWNSGHRPTSATRISSTRCATPSCGSIRGILSLTRAAMNRVSTRRPAALCSPARGRRHPRARSESCERPRAAGGRHCGARWRAPRLWRATTTRTSAARLLRSSRAASPERSRCRFWREGLPDVGGAARDEIRARKVMGRGVHLVRSVPMTNAHAVFETASAALGRIKCLPDLHPPTQKQRQQDQTRRGKQQRQALPDAQRADPKPAPLRWRHGIAPVESVF
jgi:hypothetical protein